MISLLTQKKSLHKYCRAAIGTVVCSKFALDAKVLKSGFGDMSYLDHYCS